LEGAYNPSVAYGASKTANIWTSKEIDRRYGTKGLHAFAVNPRGILTNFQQHLPQEPRVSMFESFKKWFKSPKQSASGTIRATTAEVLNSKEDCIWNIVK
jgi:NAD(P)-dependent dehydrogenase (short-subunit alcohol dehydrogenase family)